MGLISLVYSSIGFEWEMWLYILTDKLAESRVVSLVKDASSSRRKRV